MPKRKQSIEEDGLDSDGEDIQQYVEEADQQKFIKSAKKYEEKKKKHGVIYISRVPPFMRPVKVRSLMEQYGTVTNIYLVPEDKSIRKNRKKAGGNTRKKYTEGWIEFENKKLAKRVAEVLNNTIIGGKKRNYYHDDIWNLKYLKGFKWRHLTEKLAYDRRMRETRLNAEMAKATRENNAYIEHVEQSRLIAKIEARKKGTKRIRHNDNGNQIHRQFKQIKAVKRSEESERKSFKKSTLSKIFK